MEVSSSEIPIFYLFASPLLTALKFYLFEEMGDGAPMRTFEAGQAVGWYRSQIERARRIWGQYAALPRREVWGQRPFAELEAQVKSLMGKGLVSAADGRRIGEEMAGVLRALTSVVAPGRRGEAGAAAGTLELRQQGYHWSGARYLLRGGGGRGQVFLTLAPPHFYGGDAGGLVAEMAAAFAVDWRRGEALSGQPVAWGRYGEGVGAGLLG